MEETLCNISAFRLLRTPPQILALCPPVPPLWADTQRRQLKEHFLFTDILRGQAHIRVKSRERNSSSNSVVAHVQTEELPSKSGVIETEQGFEYTEPLPTLLSLAQTLNEDQLLMAAYELCGNFSVFRPTPQTEELLETAYRTKQLRRADGWHRVKGIGGVRSDLWMRPPLIGVEELRKYASKTEGLRGHKKLLRVANSVSGVVSSPFEAQASMLFALSRRRGGQGFVPLSNNQQIVLDKGARRIANKECCYGDLVFDRGPNELPLIVECQGKLVHDSLDSAISDSDRTTALQSMGFEVILLTHQQIASSGNYQIISELIADKLGRVLLPKTKNQLERERKLREQIFKDWDLLALPTTRSRSTGKRI